MQDIQETLNSILGPQLYEITMAYADVDQQMKYFVEIPEVDVIDSRSSGRKIR